MRLESDALEELLRGGAVIAQAEIRLRQVMQHDARIVWVEPLRQRKCLERLGGAAGIHQRESRRGMALREVGVERDHAAKFGERAVVVAAPQQHVAERHVRERLGLVELEGAARPALSLVEFGARVVRPVADVVRNRRRR